jgi:hypothetical protein
MLFGSSKSRWAMIFVVAWCELLDENTRLEVNLRKLSVLASLCLPETYISVNTWYGC